MFTYPGQPDTQRPMTIFTGVAISPGVGIGPAWLVPDPLELAADPAAITRGQIAGEWTRILASVEQTRHALEDSARRIGEEVDAPLARILRPHGMMLDGILSSRGNATELGRLI